MVKKTAQKVKRCYIYTRVSTKEQTLGYSLDAQEEYLRKEAEHKGYQVAEVFSDEGASGKNTTGREAFQEMIRRITNGNKDGVDYVYVYKLSRFGRNTADVMYNVQLMEDYGVKLYAVEENIDSGGPAGKILVPIMSAVAEIERENILAQTMAGRRQKAREGKWNGGQAPFGYRLQDGVLYIDEEEAQIVRIIYDRFLNSSMGANGVAKWLNSHGYKKRLRGNSKYETFTAHFVKIVLDNPVYKGMIAYGRRATEKIDGTRNDFHKVKQDEFDLWEGKHEAIIDEITWGAAQLKRKATGVRNEQKFGHGHAHVLSGVLKCPICGAGMYGRPGRKKRKDGTYYENSLDTWYYYCKHERMVDGKPCTFGQINQKDIDPEVVDLIKASLESGGFDEHMQEAIDNKSDSDLLQVQLKTLLEKRHKADLTKDRRASEIDRLDITDPAYNIKCADLQERLDDMYKEILSIDQEIEEVQKEISGRMEAEATLNDARMALTFFVENVTGNLSEEATRDLVHDFVKEVQIYPQKKDDGWIREITFNFPVVINGEEEKTFHYEETTDETVALLYKN